MTQPEVRVSPRKALRRDAKVLMKGRAGLDGRTVDISLTGICVIVAEPIAAGETCLIMFGAPISGEVKQVNAVAKVAYSICIADGFRVGFQFVQLSAMNAAVINQLLV